MASRSIPSLQPHFLFRRNLHPTRRSLCPTCLRHASTKQPTSKTPIALEKPDKFRPPSHPSRRVTRIPRHFGPALSDSELAAQKTKRYPNTFPNEGTLLHALLTSKGLHLTISLSVLLGLATTMFLQDFWRKNKFPDLLPSSSLFWSGHPLQYLRQYASVYKMHVEAVSHETAEIRRRKAEDARRRKEYLRHHGLLEEKGGVADTPLGRMGFGLEPTPEEKARLAVEEKRRVVEAALARKAVEGAGGVVPERYRGGGDSKAEEGDSLGYRDFEGRKRVKKWFGIW